MDLSDLPDVQVHVQTPKPNWDNGIERRPLIRLALTETADLVSSLMSVSSCTPPECLVLQTVRIQTLQVSITHVNTYHIIDSMASVNDFREGVSH